MRRIILNGLKDRKKWSCNGSSITIKDDKKNIHFSVPFNLLEKYLGKSYDMYLNFEQTTFYYEIDNRSKVTIHGIIHENLYWKYYGDRGRIIDNCGKWMYFFDKANYQFVEDLCKKAIYENIVKLCKHTAFNENEQKDTGVVCFYINGNSDEEHRKLLEFYKTNNLFRKTKTGKLYNISFKFDYQTVTNEYGKEFNPKIRLSDYIDLNSGDFL